MTPERVLQCAPLVLDQRARERYFADGFLTVPGYVGAAWLRRLRDVVAAKIDESRALSASDDRAVPGEITAALGSGGVSLDLRRAVGHGAARVRGLAL